MTDRIPAPAVVTGDHSPRGTCPTTTWPGRCRRLHRAALHHAPCPVLVAHRYPVDAVPQRSGGHDRAAGALR
ncbi:hypothetical protein AB0K14_23325 [Actinosynnema sp. NPDC050801]|uniref:hypothetical protein n=1 Tax=unclassified Actinosynnema TaxID=2637065 RepID=UPI0033DC9649